MATVLTLKPNVKSVQAWQFRGQPRGVWPEWVNGKSSEFGIELIHDRKSGRQVVYMGEWLVRMPDGDVWWFTDEEMHHNFIGVDDDG